MAHIAWKIVLAVLLAGLFYAVHFTILMFVGASFDLVVAIPLFGDLFVWIVNFATAWVVAEIIVWAAAELME